MRVYLNSNLSMDFSYYSLIMSYFNDLVVYIVYTFDKNKILAL